MKLANILSLGFLTGFVLIFHIRVNNSIFLFLILLKLVLVLINIKRIDFSKIKKTLISIYLPYSWKGKLSTWFQILTTSVVIIFILLAYFENQNFTYLICSIAIFLDFLVMSLPLKQNNSH